MLSPWAAPCCLTGGILEAMDHLERSYQPLRLA